MAKPSIVPVWDTNLTQCSPPTGLQITDGFVSGAIPTHDTENYQRAYTGQWCSFVNAVLTAGGTAVGDLTLASGSGGTGTITAAGLITASAGITALDYKHGSRELGVSPVGGVYSGAVSYDQTNHYATNSGAAILTLPILGLKVGDRINSVNWTLFGNAGAYSCTFALWKMTAAGTQSIVQSSGSVSTPTGASWNTHTLTVGSPVAIATGEVWFMEWTPSSAVQRLQGANVFFDRP